jgi:hypothetical protein
MNFKTALASLPLRQLTLSSASLALCASCLAQSPRAGLPEDPLPVVPTTWRLTNETWKLPAGETMGMVGGTLLFDVNEQLKLGVGSYGALRGERGGFITLGLAAEVHRKIIKDWYADAGLFVGGGGGRNGGGDSSTLAGGGLMLRGHAGVRYDTQRFGKLGIGLSHVRFPSGAIESTQPYLLYEYAFSSLVASDWVTTPVAAPANVTPLQSKPQEFALVYRHYKIPDSVVQVGGAAQYRSMELLGVEWLSYLDKHWFVKIEAEGAMGGNNSGYMQILTGAGYRFPLSASTAVKIHAAAGPAGGGSTDTGGGLLTDGGIALQQKISRSTALEVSLGQVRATSASFKASSLALKLNHQFGLPGAVDGATWSALAPFESQRLRMRTVSQTYRQGSPDWRSSNADSSVHNLGVQLDYFFPGAKDSMQIFLTGQGLAAYAGKAGAYMTGLVGVGAQAPLSADWFVESEGLVGAAGGGGLAVGNGLVSQVNAGVGYRLSKSLSVLGTAGYMSALQGDFRAKVVGLSLAYQFTGFAQR